MSENGYAAMAEVYDLLDSEVDYAAWAEYIGKTIKKFQKTDSRLVLDLGCGTGKMTFALRALGYDMTAVDISPEMLDFASGKARAEGIGDILWLCQDMTEFELYGTVDAAVCCLDGINHLIKDGDTEKCFRLVHNYLIPDGIFMFDLNTPLKFETVYRENDYVLEDDGVLLAWQNDYDGESGLCDFYYSVFREDADGRYTRRDGIQTERCYEKDEIVSLLDKCGFEILSFSSGYDWKKAEKDAERWYITARCLKK